MISPLAVVESTFRTAANCRRCFEPSSGLNVRSAQIDVAQPRWVGPDYETSKRRVLLLMLNPGAGASRTEKNAEFRDVLRGVRSGTREFSTLLDFIRDDIFDWGRGRFIDFIHDCGLSLDNIALANVAWCATSGDEYPKEMLRTCFALHTCSLLRGLAPTTVVLGGILVWPFATSVSAILPAAKVIKTIHYANRGSKQERTAALRQVQSEIFGRSPTLPNSE